jgi:hypothetical protein
LLQLLRQEEWFRLAVFHPEHHQSETRILNSRQVEVHCRY